MSTTSPQCDPKLFVEVAGRTFSFAIEEIAWDDVRASIINGIEAAVAAGDHQVILLRYVCVPCATNEVIRCVNVSQNAVARVAKVNANSEDYEPKMRTVIEQVADLLVKLAQRFINPPALVMRAFLVFGPKLPGIMDQAFEVI